MINKERHPFRKKWGQNFLIDPNIVKKIYRTIAPIDSDNILVGIPIQVNIQANLDTLHFARYPVLKNIDNKINVENIQLSENDVTYTIKIWDVGKVVFPSIPVTFTRPSANSNSLDFL